MYILLEIVLKCKIMLKNIMFLDYVRNQRLPFWIPVQLYELDVELFCFINELTRVILCTGNRGFSKLL